MKIVLRGVLKDVIRFFPTQMIVFLANILVSLPVLFFVAEPSLDEYAVDRNVSLASGVATVYALIISMIAYGVATLKVTSQYQGSPISWRRACVQLCKRGRRMILAGLTIWLVYFLVLLCCGLIALGSALLFQIPAVSRFMNNDMAVVALVTILFAVVGWYFLRAIWAIPLALVEDHKMFTTLKKSFVMTKGNVLRILLIQVCVLVSIAIIVAVIAMPFLAFFPVRSVMLIASSVYVMSNVVGIALFLTAPVIFNHLYKRLFLLSKGQEAICDQQEVLQ